MTAKKTPDADVSATQDLANLLRRQPDDQEARFRLIRLYYEQDRLEEFLREAREYQNGARRGLDATRSPAVVEMGRRLAPFSPLFGGGGADIIDPVVAADEQMQKTQEIAFQRFGDTYQARPLFDKLQAAYEGVRRDPKYFLDLELELVRAGARPTPLLHARRLSEALGGAQVFFKREDVGRFDGHLQISTIGQVHLARTLGRRRMVAGLRKVNWGVTLAAAAARYGLQTEVFLERSEYERQAANVAHMALMGARIHAVDARNYHNEDVREAALAEWVRHPEDVYLFMGLDGGPHPVNLISRDLIAAIGRECRRQLQSMPRRAADLVVARGGQNPDAIGLMPAFFDDKATRRACVDAADPGAASHAPKGDEFDPFARRLSKSEESRALSILSGSEYPSVEREIAWLRSTGAVEYHTARQPDALKALEQLAQLEGLTCGLETAHAVAWACAEARKMPRDQAVAILLAERGEKDLWDVARLLKLYAPAPG